MNILLVRWKLKLGCENEVLLTWTIINGISDMVVALSAWGTNFLHRGVSLLGTGRWFRSRC
jgi:hypothetical protein